jgi:hypothetical protein
VKISGTCARCGRAFVGEQAVASGGRCPWCSEPFSPDYAVTLIQAIRDTDEAGTALERALSAMADLDPAFRVDHASVLGEIGRQVRRAGAPSVLAP